MRKEDTVKLISAEGFEFVIDKRAAMVSQTIRNMLTSPGIFPFFSFLEKIRLQNVGRGEEIKFLNRSFVLVIFSIIVDANISLTN